MESSRHYGYANGLNFSSQMAREYRSCGGWLPGLCAGFCGMSVRLLLMAVLIVNLAIASILVQRYTTIDGITLTNATPPVSIIFTMVVSAVTLFWLLVSFCCIAAPIFLIVGDTISFVGWFAASVLIGSALNQTLAYSCQTIAISLSGTGRGIGSGLGFSQSQIAQQIFDSCNISKTLFAFHVIAAALFIVTAFNAAVSAACLGRGGRRGRQGGAQGPEVQQQNNYYGPAGFGAGGYRGGMRSTPGPEIVV